MKQRWLLLWLGLMLTGCQAPLPLAELLDLSRPLLQPMRTVIRGEVRFPAPLHLQATANDIVPYATVSLIGKKPPPAPDKLVSLATGWTDASGKFTLETDDFVPSLGETYILEAYKGLSNSQAGNSPARLRTLVKWTQDGWDSLSGFSKVVISPATTAVTIIQDLLDLDAARMLSLSTTPTILPDTDDFSAGSTGIAQSDYDRVLFLVNKVLDKDNDPITHTVYDPVGLFFFNTIIARPFLAGDVTTTAGGALHRDGAANIAMFFYPSYVTFDTSGQNLLINDGGNRVIRRYNLASQSLSTPAGVVWNRGSQNGAGSQARFESPNQLEAYNKNGINGLLISEYGNHRVRLLDLDTNIVSTLFNHNYCYGVVYDGTRYIYITSYNEHSIYRIDTDNGMAQTRIGGHYELYPPPQTGGYFVNGGADGDGAANNSYFTYPLDLAIDRARNILYVTDHGNHRIRSIDLNDPNFPSKTVVGSSAAYQEGTGSAARLYYPRGLVYDPGTDALYFSDSTYHMVRKITVDGAGVGTTTLVSGAFNGADFFDGSAANSKYNSPVGLTVRGGNLYLADNANHRIRVISLANGFSSTLTGNSFVDGPAAQSRFLNMAGVTGNAKGFLFIAEEFNRTIRKYDPETDTVITLAGARDAGFIDGPGTAARFNYPFRMTFDGNQFLFVSDINNNAIRKVHVDTGVTSTIHKKQSEGATLSDGPLLNTYFDQPRGLDYDEDEKILYVLERNRLRQIDFNSGDNSVVTLTGSGSSNADTTLAQFRFNGNPLGLLYLGNGIFYFTEDNRLRKIDVPNNQVTTVAGSTSSGYADGKPELSFFSSLEDLVTDGAGTIYLVDRSNGRIRRYLISEKKVTTVAGGGSGIPALDSKGPSARLDSPRALYFDEGARALFVVESSGHYAGEINNVINPGNKLRRIE